MIVDIKKLEKEFGEVLHTIIKLSDTSDIRVYLVGGVVRDILLGKKVLDLDIVVEGNAIEFSREISRLLNVSLIKHHTFGTATIYFKGHKIDFATSRKEVYPTFGKLPKVYPSDLKDDLFRRDFTINAIAISLNKNDCGKVIDLYNGIKDLQNGLIRVLHKKSFLEDPTRILRSIRFEQRFSFKIEADTLRLLKEAIALNALLLVHPHRLRDELILLLREENVCKVIKRAYSLGCFSFINTNLKFRKRDFELILRLEKAIFYYKSLKNSRKLQDWIIYLIAILMKLSYIRILKFIQDFGLRKGERISILSAKRNLRKIERLNRNLKPHLIFSILDKFSYETIIFFYGYYPNKKIRENIRYFLEKLVNIRIILKGDDLKKIGIKPLSIYGKILQKLLYRKMDKNLNTKEEELKEVKNIFSNLERNLKL